MRNNKQKMDRRIIVMPAESLLLTRRRQEPYAERLDYHLHVTANGVEIAPYNGIPSDTNSVNLSTWINLYSSIYDAEINNLICPETQ
jgi:hypothetical protein